jgi:hypothetical protein
MTDCYYVFIAKDKLTKEFYIGCRHGLYIPPDKDTQYIGSGAWPLSLNSARRKFLEKTILLVFTSRESARAFEWLLICAYKRDHLCRNLTGHDRKREERYRRHQRIIEMHRAGMSLDDIYDNQESPEWTRGTIHHICRSADKGILLARLPNYAHARQS